MKLGFAQLLSIVLLGSALVLITDGNAQTESVLASYYGAELAGQPTASGEPFDPHGYTAAHPTLPLGTKLLVSYAGRSVEVTVNDRGPYAGGWGLDLSQTAAEYLGLTAAGVDYVDYVVIGGATADSAGYTIGESYSAEDPSNDEQTRGRYVVQEGDTLSGIAAELGTTVEQLASRNGIEDPNLLYPGQTLRY